MQYLNEDEKRFVNENIDRLRREHPKVFDLLKNGEDSVYEACLVRDWLAGKFDAEKSSARK